MLASGFVRSRHLNGHTSTPLVTSFARLSEK